MQRRGLRRFVLEVLFLAGVAAALTVADLRPAAVIALMAVALVVVWLFEWASWLDQPHYGRGLPPRYYVPHVALPPPRPVEQYRGGGYPDPRARRRAHLRRLDAGVGGGARRVARRRGGGHASSSRCRRGSTSSRRPWPKGRR